MDLDSKTRRLVIGCEKTENGGQIWFTADGVQTDDKETVTAQVMQLAAAIQAVVFSGSKNKAIRIELPDRMKIK